MGASECSERGRDGLRWAGATNTARHNTTRGVPLYI